MMDKEGRGIKCTFSPDIARPQSRRIADIWFSVTELIRPPDLNQARVNKCLIALVNRKIVQKDNSTVRVLSVPNSILVSNLILDL